MPGTLSRNAGHSWQSAYPSQHPTSSVETGNNGEVYAFMLGVGLVKYQDGDWVQLSNDFGGRYLLHLAIDPQDPNRLYAVAQGGEILASSDGGRRWQPFVSR